MINEFISVHSWLLLVSLFIRFFREIQYCEFSIKVLCGPVVCLSGVDFIAEITNHLSCVINTNHGTPSFPLFVVPDSSVL